MIHFLAWCERHQYPMLIALLVLIAALLLAGCGSERDTQTKTVERLTTTTGPVVVDTPIGQFVAQPIRHEMTRSEEAVETQQTRISLPDVTPLIQAASSGMSMGPLGIAGTLLGVVTTAAAGWTAMKSRRHRDQLIDSVESAREELTDDNDEKFVKALGVKQDKDLQDYIQKRTA